MLYSAGDTSAGVEIKTATGADLDESRVEVVLYVDAARGSDRNPGTAERPYATVAAGVAAANQRLAAGQPTKLQIAAGVYREGEIELDVSAGRTKQTLFVIEGEDPETTVITGADHWGAERWEDLGDGVYAAAWPHDWGFAGPRWGPPGAIGHRREAVHLDGHVMTQVFIEEYSWDRPKNWSNKPTPDFEFVAKHDPKDVLRPGDYGVSEEDDKLYIRLDPGVTPADVKLEVSLRRRLIVIGDKANFVLRNLTLTQAANDFARHDGYAYGMTNALTMGKRARNLLIDNCRFTWNNFFGLRTQGSDITVRDTIVNYSGYGGFGGNGDNVLFENCTSNYNNWRGHWGRHYGWNHAGTKMGVTGLFTIRDHTAVGNLAGGIWFDIHCKHVRVEDSLMALNHRFGLFYELSQGPFSAERNLIVHNHHTQFKAVNTGYVLLKDNVFYGNNDGGGGWGRLQTPLPVIKGLWYVRKDGHATREPLKPEHMELVDNVIAGGKKQPTMFAIYNGGNRTDPDYGPFEITGAGNLLHYDLNEAFVYNDEQWGLHIVQAGPFSRVYPFPVTGNDRQDPMFRDADGFDFRVESDSPVVDRSELPLRRIDPSLVDESVRFYAWSGLSLDQVPYVIRERVEQARETTL
ncbi:MAG: right-handed parallel beta-helix repeat-containing protein [Planctomycetota bacterium]